MCDVTLSVYPHRAGLKNMPGHGGTQFRNIAYSNRPDRVAQLAERWASIPKVVGSNPTVARHIVQACPVWIYTQSNITQASYVFCFDQFLVDVTSGVYGHYRPSPFTLSVKQKIANFEPLKVHEDQIFEL